ncbi:MAG: hypothetical protein LBJ12_01705 [Oscillospiraceae bacterium]|jgi:hypothetical protein|nr:hypothetical protein [Oscillospiraceae bacterium]
MGICYGNGMFVAVSASGSNRESVLTCPDRPSGLNLREVVVNMSDKLYPSDNPDDWPSLWEQDNHIAVPISQSTLAINTRINKFFGSIDNTKKYRPGIDYEVGDLVTFIGLDRRPDIPVIRLV